MIRSRVFCSWDLKPSRNLNDWEFEDEMTWVGDEDRGFSVSSMHDALCPQILEYYPEICG